MLREGGAGGIGAAEPLHGQASRYGGGRIYTRFARTTGRGRGIRNWGGKAAARTSFALRWLAHIYALRAHHRTWRRRGENWGGRAAAWTSFALRWLAHIYALRAHHRELLREGGAEIGAAEPLHGQASRYEGWRIYTRFARTTGLILNLVEGNQRA